MQALFLRLRGDRRNGLDDHERQHIFLSTNKSTVKHTFYGEILVHQPIPGPAHLIHRLLVAPRVAWLVFGPTPSVSAVGMRLYGCVAPAGVWHRFDRLVFFSTIEKSAVGSFAVGIRQMCAGC